MQDLDKIIDQALSDEPMRALPEGFHDRMECRLKVASLIRKEQRRFVRRMLGATSGLLGILLFGIYLLAGDVRTMAEWAVPGVWGYWDYVSSVHMQGITPSTVVTAGLILAIGLMLVTAGFIWRLSHHRSPRRS